ncbi:MAG: ERAP1-like C-terminal domain-containing protein [Candidatus Cloacimonetes bacterium]|nr:ERAP1-like C-terminal domain-containing protein [Candidatus Cloacimonadota bacterium]
MQKTHKLTKSQAEVRKKQIGNLGYRLRIHIDENRDYFEGLAQIEATVFRKDMDLVLDCADTEIMSIKNAEGQEILYRHQDHQLILESKNFAVAMLGDRLDLQITYRSRFSENGLGFFRFCDQADGRYYCYTDLEPFEAHRVFPCFDQPDLKIRFSLEVSAPAKWEVFANEPVLSTMLEGERRVWSFMETPPISTYVFSLVAGEYKVVEFGEFKVPMRVAGRHSQFHKIPVERMAEVAQLSLDYFEKLLDCEYPFRKHDQIFVPEYTSGAMENCGLVTFSEYWLSDSEMTHRQKMALDNTIAHEMAHMWFGNLVTMTWWGDLWLNESFATQLAYRCLAETGLYPEAMLAFTYEVKQMAMQADELSSTHPIVADCVDTEAAFANFDRITYEKGACVLQQMIALMGMPEFLQGIRGYLKKFAYSNATYQEFLACFGQEFFGELNAFCEDWFLSSGVNNLTVTSNKKGSYKIRQEAGSGSQRLRTHRVMGLALKIKDGQLIEVSKKPVVVKDQEVEVFRFEKDSIPDLVFLNHEDWAYARVFLDPDSLSKIAQVLPLIDRPFLRQQLWLTMGDMVERERMSPLTYLNLAIQLVEQETDSLIVLSILDDLQPFFSSYLPEPVKQTVRSQIFDMACRLLAKETDYGVLVRWFTTAVSAACTLNHLDALAEWLQSKQVGNLSLSKDYIYNGLYKLAYGRHKNTESLLRTMEAEDGRETGIKCARVIRLILKRDKQEDFFRILSQSGGSQDMLSWEMRAFFHPMQKGEQQELVLAYFDALPEIFASRDKIFCRSLMDSMFPLAYIEESLSQSVALLQRTDLNQVLRRGLTDRVDLMSRYQRICARVMQENYELQC